MYQREILIIKGSEVIVEYKICMIENIYTFR